MANWFTRLFRKAAVAVIPEDCRLEHGGKVYDKRYWRVTYLDDSPPMHDVGKDYVWEPDTMVTRKERWEPTYGTPYARVSDMPKHMQERLK